MADPHSKSEYKRLKAIGVNVDSPEIVALRAEVARLTKERDEARRMHSAAEAHVRETVLEYRGMTYRAEQAESEVLALRALLLESKRAHYHCEDTWYCCALCDSSDHGQLDSHDGEAPRTEGVCNCRAAEWNAKVEAALTMPITEGTI